VNCNKSVGIVCIKLKSSLIFFLLEKTELTIEDKYKRTMQEIECLKDELGKFFFVFYAVQNDIAAAKKYISKTYQSHSSAARSEIARRSKDTADRMKEKMREAKEEVESEQLNKLDISSGNLHRPQYTARIQYCTLWAGVTFADYRIFK